jgi:hypothetical protein
MNYAMEDSQNAAPGALPAAQAAKLAPRKGPDAQSTTKRFVPPPPPTGCRRTVLTVFEQPPNRIDAAHDLFRPWHLRIPLRRRQPPLLDRYDRGPDRDAIRWSYIQAILRLPFQLPLCSPDRPLQDPDLPPQC